MIIYIWPNGNWKYSWELKGTTYPDGFRAVDLDKWYEYNLSELEVLACLEALEE